METRTRSRLPIRADGGAISLVALCLMTALGVAVSSYIALFSQSYDLSVRQFQNDRARELAQTGLEEALWALNQDNWSSSGPTNNAAWSTTGDARTVTLNYSNIGHGATGQLLLTVDKYASTGPLWPTITAEARVTLLDGRVSTRKIQAVTAPAPLFGNAIASANGCVSFSAGGTVDSWNSDPDNNPATAAVAYAFTAGTPANHAAVIAGRTNGTHGVVLTQAQVRGYVATFGQPVGFSTSSAPPARVLGPATSGVDVDTARLGRSAFVPVSPVFNVVIPPATVPPPSGGGLLGALLRLLLGLVDALLNGPPGSAYKTGDLTIDDSASSIRITKPGMQLVVDGNLAISGTGKITVESTGSLTIFVTGDVTIGGGGMDNRTQDPKKLALFCTSSSTTNSLQYTTSENFCGVIYCENKPIDIRQNATFYGAVLSREDVTFSTSATAPVFHYDTALRTTRFDHITTPYVITRLTEL